MKKSQEATQPQHGQPSTPASPADNAPAIPGPPIRHPGWKFRDEANRFRRLRKVVDFSILLFVVFSAVAIAAELGDLGLVLQQAALAAAMLAFVAIPAALLWQRRLSCPACRRRLIQRLGAFCPECGSRSLGSADPCDLRAGRPCSACGRTLHWGKGAHVRLRHCTHCGLLLDERGMEVH